MRTGLKQNSGEPGLLDKKNPRKRRYTSIKKTKNGQQALLVALLCYHGGSTKLSRKLSRKLEKSYSRQVVHNWITRGYVPLQDIWAISRALGVTPYVLNYRGYKKVVPSELTFKEVVSSCKFLPTEVRFDIKAKVRE